MKTGKTPAAAAAAVLVAITIVSITYSQALSQSRRDFLDLRYRIEKLESRTDGRAMGRTAGPGQTGGAVAELSQRVAELEDALRRLNGRLEVLEQRLAVVTGRAKPQRRAAPPPAGAPRVLTPPARAKTPGAPGPGVRVLGQIRANDLPRNLRAGQMPQSAPPIDTDPARPLEKYNAAYGLILQKDFPAATKAFSAFLTDYPRHDLSGNAQYWLAQSYFARGKNARAAREFLKGYKSYPESPKAPNTLLKLGMALAALGETSQACAAFREYAGKYSIEARASGNRVAAEMRNARC